MMTAGNAVCWSGDFTFERCCGTLDPECFGAEFTYEGECTTLHCVLSQTAICLIKMPFWKPDCCPTEEGK
jgi:hypothetical protein